jgi:hypothetical protein
LIFVTVSIKKNQGEKKSLLMHIIYFPLGGPRKQSLGNIYQQPPYSQSTPANMSNNGGGGGGGALDNLMADLMNSMNDDLHLGTMPTKINNNSCGVCGEEFDYRDDVKTVDNKVKFDEKP